MTGADALWSAQEVRTQAEQCSGQVDIWEALTEACECPRDGFLCDACERAL